MTVLYQYFQRLYFKFKITAFIRLNFSPLMLEPFRSTVLYRKVGKVSLRAFERAMESADYAALQHLLRLSLCRVCAVCMADNAKLCAEHIWRSNHNDKLTQYNVLL